MALQWEWKDKCGEITLVQMHPGEEDREYRIDLYQGNAYLIMIHEYTDERRGDVYELFGFFNDKQHMKNCLGLNKKGGYASNMYETPYQKITNLRINKAKYRHTSELVATFTEAFKNIQIEIFTEAELGVTGSTMREIEIDKKGE